MKNLWLLLYLTGTTFTITMAAQETGTPVTNAGSTSILCYYSVGPAQQLGGFGWGTGLFGGTVLGRSNYNTSN